MTEETEVIEPTEEIVESLEVEEVEEELSYEDKAKPLGWKTLDEFRGDKAYWTDAETFIKNGEESLPILRSNMKKMQRELHTVKGDLAMQKSIHKTGMEAQRKKIEAEYDGRAREAVREGDEEAFNAASKQRDADLAAHDAVVEQPQEDPKEAIAAFESRNKWFGENQIASDFADAESGRLRGSHPHLSIEENLERVESAVKDNFPDLFGNSKRSRKSSVETGRRPNGKAKTKTYAAMPAEYRAACDSFVRDGQNQATYVKNYYAMQEAES